MTQTIVRYVLGLLFAFLVGKGAITQTQSNSMLPDLVQDLSLIFGGLFLVGWSFLQKKLAGVLPSFFSALGRTSPSVKLLPFALALGLGTYALTGCGGTASVPTGTGAATAPTLAQTIAADFKGLTGDALSFANGLQKLNNGNILPPAAVTEILKLTHNNSDAATAATLNNLLGQFVAAQSMASTPAQSISNANQVLAPTNVNATVQAVTPATAVTTPPTSGT